MDLGHSDASEDPLAEPRRLQRVLIDAGREILDLAMINPDLAPPRYLLDKLSEGVGKAANHRYAVSRGIRRLRSAFALKYESTFGVVLDPEREVCVCLGGKDALLQTLRVLIRPEDRVVLIAPTYPAHLSAVSLCGGSPVFVELGQTDESLIENFERVIERERPKCVVLNFPHNPTGRVLLRDTVDRLVEVTARRQIFLINDFVYGEMGFDRSSIVPTFVPNNEHRDFVVETYSLSKAYSVPGWRVGAIVGAHSIVRAVSRLKSQIDYGLFLPLQGAAAAALSSPNDIVSSTVREYERRARTLVQGLSRLGWEVSMPEAGCCVWAKMPRQGVAVAAIPDTEGVGLTSLEFTVFLLQHHGVLVSPGVLFGAQFDGWIRFALVIGEDRIREVVRRIGQCAGPIVDGVGDSHRQNRDSDFALQSEASNDLGGLLHLVQKEG